MENGHYEVNFDGIAGTTHFYSGMAFGNTASMKNMFKVSHPKEAALQCLQKMKFLADMGLIQGVFPLHERPFLPMLRLLGFTGKDHEILQKAHKEAPIIFYACFASASMWTANAATFTPSVDSNDNRSHFTPANLSYAYHRSIEHLTTDKILRKIFNDPLLFNCHPILPEGTYFSDEGAANHTRFCKNHGDPGVHLFVYGRYSTKPNALQPVKFPARQTFEGSEAIVRRHLIPREQVIFAQQNPQAIDEGVFHNDVISVGNENVFLYHEKAFVGTDTIIKEIDDKVKEKCDTSMIFICVKEEDITIKEAVESYLFNSQLVTLKDNFMTMIAPIECMENTKVKQYLEKLTHDPSNPIQSIHYLNIRESMLGGGGPACLRLRTVLSKQEIQSIHQPVLLTEKLYIQLASWIDKHYREKLSVKDFADPLLLEESYQALDELSSILKLGSIYFFQK